MPLVEDDPTPRVDNEVNEPVLTDIGIEAMLALQTSSRCWCVRPELLATLAEIDGRFVDARLARTLAAAPDKGGGPTGFQVTDKGVAIISMQGAITPKATLLGALFGCGNLDTFKSQLTTAVNSPDVKSIVFNIDSPGGLVDQVPETAEMIRAARDVKPIVAVANTQAASAAYWLASQAHEIVVTPSGEVGSIGVYQMHKDISASMAKAGVKPTLISAGKYKVEGNPFEPLSEEAQASYQQPVNDYYDMFTKGVAQGRGVSVDDVRNGYGEGRVLLAQRAVRSGLADRVATLDQTVNRLSSGRAKLRRAEAEGFTTTVLVWEEESDVIAADDSLELELSAEDKDRLLTVLAGRREAND
jgi:signal peptide peptidase SppA